MLPPSNPKIPLDNFLLLLREDIKLIGISPILQKWHKNKMPNFSFACKKLEISENFYRCIINGKKPLPLWFLKRLSHLDSNLSNKIYKNFSFVTARNSKDILPTFINPQLAYYIGFLHGDGHVDRNEKRISFSEKYGPQLEIINKLTNLLFNVDGDLYFRKEKTRKFWTLDVRRVTINSFFSDVLGIKRGKRISNKIPEIIKENKGLLRWYLCGLFDAEGAMPLKPKNKKNLYIDIAMRDSQLINEVKDLLYSIFGITTYGPYRRLAKSPHSKNVSIEAELKIRKHSEIKKFLSIIGTIHPDKVRRKKLILNLLNKTAPVAQLG